MRKPIKILIVDDDLRMTSTLADILHLEGLIAFRAASAAEALEMLKTTRVDCVLSDVKMPGINGVELQQVIQKTYPELPVILMTAYSEDELIQQGLSSGVVAVLEKPLNLDLLLNFFASLHHIRTIAIVDDDPVFSNSLAEILQKHGYQVNNIIKPHLTGNNLPDDRNVRILDLRLNHVNGDNLLGRILASHSNLPMLIVTGYPQEVQNAVLEADELDELYAHTSLTKPLETGELLRILAEIKLNRVRRTFSEF